MEQKNKVIDVTGTELTPGDPHNCLGGDNHPEHPLCCDNCDYFLDCSPEYEEELNKALEELKLKNNKE